jgi:hypothetical protein
MKTAIKAVIAFSTLALAAGGALAQTSTDKSGSGSTASPAAPATPTTPVAPSTRSSEGAKTGGVAQNNPGVNPKEGPSPNPKEGASSSSDRTATGPATRDTRGGGKVTFGSLDANNDGKVSKTEAEAQPDLASAFSKLDKNKDGMLDQAEYKAHKSK